MLEIMVILLNLFAFGLLFLGIEYEGEQPYWNIIFTFISSLLFIMCAGYTTTIETPYELYNGTSIETGYHIYYLGDLIYFYFGLFIASFMYFFDLMFHKQLVKLFKR